MLSGLVRYLRLMAQAKTGLSPVVVVLAILALIGAATTFILVVFSAFIWLAEHYTPLTAALILVAFFFLVTVLAAVGAMMAQRRTASQAELALQARSRAAWLDPSTLAMVLQVGRSVGLRRILPLVAAGILAACFAREWMREPPTDEIDPNSE